MRLTAIAMALLVAAAGAATAGGASPAASPPPRAARIVAQATTSRVPVFRFPGAKRPFVTLDNPSAHGGPVVFLVVQRLRGWERVLLPRRPNGSTGWIRDRAVSLSYDPYRVVVSRRRHRIDVWKGRILVHSEPAGVGRSVLPTPTGEYFLVELLRQPDPTGPYGPYAFGLSAFSDVLYSFGGGPGQIGLHGTDDPAGLGADVSHGCVRISNRGIALLARLLPLGTPVTIVG